MDGLYDIYRGQEKIGKAEVKQEGLYYRFRCVCDLSGEVIYRITVSCGESTENLGIPIPSGDSFYLEKKIPVSHFSGQGVIFRAMPRHPQVPDMWIPIKPEQPFEYIDRLENAVAEQRNGEMGILIPSEDPVPQDNDQIP